ncbi:hypothetical protein [Metabacillus litoralis]|uniref:hypothetical protein n=1 Tax=Metabacillus litoralis TaxID=152268 RepID=UPI000EF61CE8|nr:hypothetical protein [Metabacillus litoralis]MCM3160036.1 hypothetical protein [Metabacillus litoralis]MCM3408620.1 hypothetical protein [Metabacillus litoralis]
MLKYSRLLLFLMMILPWFSLPVIDKKSFKRFYPASLFISIIVWLESFIAKKRRWWWFYERIHPKIRGETPLIWGPFFIGSLWIMKFTYGKFYLYLLINLLVDSFFSFRLVNWFQKLGISSLVRMNRLQLLFVFQFKALLLYGFQFIKEKGNRVKFDKSTS